MPVLDPLVPEATASKRVHQQSLTCRSYHAWYESEGIAFVLFNGPELYGDRLM